MKVLILGAGGHGIIPLLELIANQEFTFDIVLNCVDDGGDTGRSFMVMEELFPSSGNIARPVGDLRNNISVLLEEKTALTNDETAEKLHDSISTRSSEGNVILEKLGELINNLQSFDATLSDFIINNAANYIDKYSKLFPDKEVSVGNLFLNLTQIYCLDNGHDFVAKLKESNLIPQNVNFHFEHAKRLVLTGKDEVGNELEGEAKIDTSQLEVQIESLSYTDQYGRLVEADEMNPAIADMIDSADIIIIPTGSSANSFPNINIFQEKLSTKVGKIYNICNLTQAPNEEGIVHQIMYIEKLLGSGLVRHLVVPEEGLVLQNGIASLLSRYYSEGKKISMLTSKQIDQLSKAGIRIIDSMRAIGYKKKPEGDEPDPEVGLRHFRGVLANFIMYLLDGGEAENYVPVYSEMDKRIIEAIGRRPEITEELSID